MFKPIINFFRGLGARIIAFIFNQSFLRTILGIAIGVVLGSYYGINIDLHTGFILMSIICLICFFLFSFKVDREIYRIDREPRIRSRRERHIDDE